MQRGTVKWFNRVKGYGFIVGPEGEKDIFFHHSVIKMAGYRFLDEGQEVEYEVEKGPKGLQATIIKPIVRTS